MRLEDLVSEWTQRGDADLAAAIFLRSMRPQPLEIIAFHCQQTVEKYLKAYLVSKGEEPDKTHDIGILIRRAEGFDPEFASLSSSCVALTDYAVKVRYPGASVIDEKTVAQAIAIADEAIAFVKTRLRT